MGGFFAGARRAMVMPSRLRGAVLAATLGTHLVRSNIILRKIWNQHWLRMTGELFGQPYDLLAKFGVWYLQIGQHKAQAFLVRGASNSPHAQALPFAGRKLDIA